MRYRSCLAVRPLSLRWTAMLLILAVISLASACVDGAPVSSTDGERAAQAFLHYEAGKSLAYRTAVGVPEGVRIKGKTEFRDPESGDLLGYVFTLDPSGYLVMPAETRLVPVIAYSYAGEFPWEESEENILLSMLRLDLRWRFVALAEKRVPQSIPDSSEALWRAYLEADEAAAVGDSPTVYGPWLSTDWYQRSPYNDLCPWDSVHKGRSAVGCTALALAQILNYWKYPTAVAFSADDSYTTASTDPDHRFSIDALAASFGGLDYGAGEPSETDRARLCYAAGVSVRMNYCSDVSGAWVEDVAGALAGSVQLYPGVGVPERWGYESANVRSYDSIHSGWGSPYYVIEAEFFAQLADDMTASRPAEMHIYSTSSSHAIVVDGWQSGARVYHLNFGWAGTSSGWYSLPEGLPAGYTVIACAVLNIHPTVVTFPDPGLEAAVRAAIGKPMGDIPEWHLVELTTLDAGDRVISGLAGIEHCVNLQLLSLDHNQITDLVPLVGLTALKTLYLENNQISDLAPLAGLTALKTLSLENNQISDLAPLAGPTALTVLSLYSNQISDLAPLAALTKLEHLDLANNQISDIAPLAGLTALKTLYLWNNQISEPAPLAGLTALTSLHLGGNKISDLAPLAALVGLAYLDVFENQISDLAPLAELTALTDLWLQTNQISNLVPLAGLTALETLYLAENQISDLAPLAELTALERLYLWNNQISDLTPLAGLTALTDLSLQTNHISELAPLVLNSGMGSGDWLDVRSNYLCLDPGSGEDLPDASLLLARGVSVWHFPQTACRPDSSAAVFRVADEGSVRADSGFYGSSFTTWAADLAEWVQVTGSVKAGDVLELDPSLDQSYRLAQTLCSTLVAGVVSTEPGVTLGASTVGPQQALLALSGIVPVKVTNEGGPIHPGALLVSSSTPGYAMRWAGPDPCPCALVGKALEPMTDERGMIRVLLTAH